MILLVGGFSTVYLCGLVDTPDLDHNHAIGSWPTDFLHLPIFAIRPRIGSAAAAEATIGDVLGDVGDMHHVSAQAADEGTEEDQMAMAAAAAAAAVQAADGMAVVVDQAVSLFLWIVFM